MRNEDQWKLKWMVHKFCVSGNCPQRLWARRTYERTGWLRESMPLWAVGAESHLATCLLHLTSIHVPEVALLSWAGRGVAYPEVGQLGCG